MRIVDVAWAAGFFDGEGWVAIQRRGGKYKGHYLRLGINHVAPEPLIEFQRLFGGNIRFDASVLGNRKPRHVWTLSCSSAAKCLAEMGPYLKNKHEVSELAAAFHATMLTRGSTTTDSVYSFREDIKQQIKALNAKD